MALRTDVAPLAQLAAREPLDAVVDVVTQVREVMAGLPGGDLTPAYGLVDGEALDGLVGEVAAAASQLDELKLRLARLAEASDRPGDVGAAGADAWLARLTGTTRACAAGGIWLARKLDQRYPAVREAFAAGALDEKRARIIVRAAETMPEAVTDAQRADAVESLVARAVRDRLNPTVLRRAARRMCDVVSRECADQHQAELLHADEVAADAETYLWLVDRGNGTSPVTLSLSARPEIGVLVESIRATLSGNGEALGRTFGMTLAGTIDDWEMVLQPRDPALRAILDWMRIDGHGPRITAIETQDREGDRSQMKIAERMP